MTLMRERLAKAVEATEATTGLTTAELALIQGATYFGPELGWAFHVEPAYL